MRYAIIVNSKVESLVEGPTPPVAAGKIVAEVKGPCQKGWVYLPSDARRPFQRPDTLARSERLTVEQVVMTMTSGEFLLRFTEQERTSIRVAAATEWGAVVAGKIESAPLSDFTYLLEHFPTVQKDNPTLLAGLAALVAAGLLKADRPTELLA